MITTTLELHEHSSVEVARADLHDGFGEAVWSRFGKYVDVDFPSLKTGNRWRFTAKGWIGYLPIDEKRGVFIRSKAPAANVFLMIERAYELDRFDFLAGRYHCESLEQFYALLAGELASRALRRVRRGLFKDYVALENEERFLRGRLLFDATGASNWKTSFFCRYEDQTTDVEDNRLILWALYLATRTLPKGPNYSMAHRAFRELRGSTTLAAYAGSACLERSYGALNSDYAPMHALSAFVIENSGPHHRRGEQQSLPFVIEMGRLFERYVVALLRSEAAGRFSIRPQERVRLAGDTLAFVFDVLVRDATGSPIRVIDTKYKLSRIPTSADVAQIVAYAIVAKVQEAVLVYPHAISWRALVGRIQVRAVGLPLDAGISECGRIVREELLEPVLPA